MRLVTGSSNALSLEVTQTALATFFGLSDVTLKSDMTLTFELSVDAYEMHDQVKSRIARKYIPCPEKSNPIDNA